MKHIVLAAALLAGPALVGAQRTDSTGKAAPPDATADSAFARARRLVVGGNGAQGRAIVDSMLAAAAPGTPEYARALYWHGSLAGTAADAERDYRRVIVDYPFSPRAGDALYALAQLESSRGDRASAVEHLQRLELEHPDFPERGRAGLMLGRFLIETGDVPRGCAALERTRAQVPATRVELRNQIDYYATRCAGVDTGAVAVPPAPKAPAESTRTARADSARGAPAAEEAPAPAKPAYTIQVAAYNTRAQAQRLVKRLVARGFAARLVGTARPYRVRVGRYAKRDEAAAAARRLKAKGIGGFVTTAEPERR